MAIKSITFTNTLSVELMQWLDSYTKKTKTTKKEIIEKALKAYQIQLKKKELAEMFQKASKDQEVVNMSEEDLDDFNSQIKTI